MNLMKNRTTFLLLLGTTLLIFSIGLFGFLMYKTYQVEIDGHNRTVKAFAWTVADGLRAAQVSVAEADLLQPAADQWLSQGGTIRIQRAAQVMILADGKLYSLLTAERTPAKILALAKIELKTGDVLLAAGVPISPQARLAAPGAAGQAPPLQVLRSVQFAVREDGLEKELTSTASTSGQALWEAGIGLNEADPVTPSLNTELKPGLQIILKHSRLVTIHAQGVEITRRTAADSVGEALAEAGLALEGLDYSQPAETTSLPADGNIQVVRVREETILEQASLPYQVEYQAAEDVELDSQKIIQTGLVGLTAKRIRVRYEDGKEVSRTVEGEWTARAPQNQINGYGTMIVKRTLDTPDGTITYWRALRMWATSYHPAETGSNETASGMLVRKGVVGIDPRYIPYFTQMYVPGYGFAVAGDTGGGVYPRLIDLGYPDAEYVEWHQYLTVYFLWPPPDNIVWIFPP